MLDIIKSIILGIIEGITEWLPISSTGHLIIADEFIKLGTSDAFKEMFNVVIQLGAILAVVVIYFKKMWPFTLNKELGYSYITKGKGYIKKDVMDMWLKVIVAILPAAVIGIPLDDIFEAHFHNYIVVALALIIYGILFIVIEKRNKNITPKVGSIADITYKTALYIGLFQALSLIPGTSRSGSTILGAIIIGVSRVAAAEFSFYMAVPVMFGASLIKLLKFGLSFTGTELLILLVGMATAFIVSVIAIKFLMSYIKKRDFTAFGYYRIVLGVVIVTYFLLAK
ncbi:MAG: undecaprenyl-diphosphate phosphatase [Acutalibacteraceae bacterium]|nr:undecaprenyl-diphosphate phosphatase [Acutalibacteraceae bacterium]